MRTSFASAVAGLAAVAAAQSQAQVSVRTVTVTAPATSTYQWNAGVQTMFPIHESCNGTQRAILERAFDDTYKVVQHAKDHIQQKGKTSPHYQKYFGTASPAEVVGWYDRILTADKSVNFFRCDDPDRLCYQDGWAGYWRGWNATEETNICPLSFYNRRTVDGLCMYGWTVATGTLNLYWASDLIHRVFHLPNIGGGVVEHWADGYAKVIDLPKTNPNATVENTHTLQYFALEVYAFDITAPGQGCPGVFRSSSSASSASATASASGSASATSRASTTAVASAAASSAASSPASASSSVSRTSSSAAVCQTMTNGVVYCQAASAVASSMTMQTVTRTTSAGAECHTHADGALHCV